MAMINAVISKTIGLVKPRNELPKMLAYTTHICELHQPIRNQLNCIKSGRKGYARKQPKYVFVSLPFYFRKFRKPG